MGRFLVLGATLACLSGSLHAQTIPLEYQVKAAFLFNFVKFVDWPTPAAGNGIDICVYGANPFGTSLEQLVRDETVNGRAVNARGITEADASCQVIFIPRSATAAEPLRGVQGKPILTVGEDAGFLGSGGIIRLFIDNGTVHFEINESAAARAGLTISSRLLRLARPAGRTPPRS